MFICVNGRIAADGWILLGFGWEWVDEGKRKGGWRKRGFGVES